MRSLSLVKDSSLSGCGWMTSKPEVIPWSLKVFVLYLDRPCTTAGFGTALCGQCRYSDLKGAALRGGFYVFFYLTGVMRMACVRGAAGQVGRLQPWSVWSWAVLMQPGGAAEVVL